MVSAAVVVLAVLVVASEPVGWGLLVLPAGELPVSGLSDWSPEVGLGGADPLVPGWVACSAAPPTKAVDPAGDGSRWAADGLDPDPPELDTGTPVAPWPIAPESPSSTDWAESATDNDPVDDWVDWDTSSSVAPDGVVAVVADGPGDALAVAAAELSSPLVTGVSGG